MRGADSAVMTGFDRLSYQSRWLQVAPERKFLLWAADGAGLYAAGVGPGADAGADRRADLLAAAGLILALVPLDGATLWLFAGRRADHSVQRQPRSADAVSELRLGAFSIGISAPGLAVAGETFWRSLAAMAATLWLVLNLPFPQLIILLKRGRVPRLLTEQILLTWRFIFILLDEAMAIHRAQTCVLAMVACRRAIARWRCWWDCCSPASSCAISR